MMNGNDIFNAVRSFDLENTVREIGQEGHILTQTEITALTVTAALGLLLCLFGFKIIRFWAALAGLVLGTAVGAGTAALSGGDDSVIWIAGLVCGILLAVLGAVLYRAGIFLAVFTAVSSFCAAVINPQDWIFAVICLAAGIAAAILAVRFAAVLTIFVTAVYGAAAAGTAVYYLLPVEGRLIHIALCIVTGIIGLLVQLLLESKRQKKKSLKKAEEIRGERSTANEVERARAMMEELESMPESRTAEEDTAEETKGTETEDQEPSDEK